MRVSDLRRRLTEKTKIAVLELQARCWACAERLAGDAVYSVRLPWPETRVTHAGCFTVGRVNVNPKQRTRVELLVGQCRCAGCGDPLRKGSTHFDHRPPLEQRKINRQKTDFIPPQDDPQFLEAIDVPCHQFRTTGRKPGAEKTVTTLGSDVHVAAKFRRMSKPKKQGRPWPSRDIPSRPFRKEGA